MLFEVFLNCACFFCIGFTKLFLETASDCKAIWSSWNSSGPGPRCPNPESFWFQKYISEALTSETSAETLKYISISTLAVCISQTSFSNTSGQLWPQKLHESRFAQPALLQIPEKRNTHDQFTATARFCGGEETACPRLLSPTETVMPRYFSSTLPVTVQPVYSHLFPYYLPGAGSPERGGARGGSVNGPSPRPDIASHFPALCSVPGAAPTPRDRPSPRCPARHGQAPATGAIPAVCVGGGTSPGGRTGSGRGPGRRSPLRAFSPGMLWARRRWSRM